MTVPTFTDSLQLSIDILHLLNEIDEEDFDNTLDSLEEDGKYDNNTNTNDSYIHPQFQRMNTLKLEAYERRNATIEIFDPSKSGTAFTPKARSRVNDDAFSWDAQNSMKRQRSASDSESNAIQNTIYSCSTNIMSRNKMKNEAKLNLLKAKTNTISNDYVMPSNSNSYGQSNNSKTKSILQMTRILYEKVELRDRKSHMHTYMKCFVARDAVEQILLHPLLFNNIDNKLYAIKLGQTMQNMQIIHHISYDKQFSNDGCLFQFAIDDQHRNHNGNNNNERDLDLEFGLTKNNKKDGKLPIPYELICRINLKKLPKHKTGISRFIHLSQQMIELPTLRAWMYKKSSAGFQSWQKRWIIVQRTHILWSNTWMITDTPMNPTERKRFNNCITLLAIRDIRPINSKGRRKFDIVTTSKVYHWKANSPEERRMWIDGLYQYLQVLSNSMNFLNQAFIDA